MNFIVNEFRWLTTDDSCMREFNNWSRPYEYAFVLNKIASMNDNISIHNTCCGTGDIHLQFAKRLSRIFTNVLHSDMIVSGLFTDDKIDVVKYNIKESSDRKFDVVICVSSFEDVYDSNPIDAKPTFFNLLDQVKSSGKLLITCDYPTVPLNFCEDLLGQKILDSDPKLNSSNSVFPRTDFSHYRIIAIDLTKI